MQGTRRTRFSSLSERPTHYTELTEETTSFSVPYLIEIYPRSSRQTPKSSCVGTYEDAGCLGQG